MGYRTPIECELTCKNQNDPRLKLHIPKGNQIEEQLNKSPKHATKFQRLREGVGGAGAPDGARKLTHGHFRQLNGPIVGPPDDYTVVRCDYAGNCR